MMRPPARTSSKGDSGIATLRQTLFDPRLRCHLQFDRAVRGVRPQDIFEDGAGADQVAAAVKFLEARVGQHEAFVPVEQSERLRNALDGVHELALHEIQLLRALAGAQIELLVLPLAVQNQRDEYAADDDDGKEAEDELESAAPQLRLVGSGLVADHHGLRDAVQRLAVALEMIEQPVVADGISRAKRADFGLEVRELVQKRLQRRRGAGDLAHLSGFVAFQRDGQAAPEHVEALEHLALRGRRGLRPVTGHRPMEAQIFGLHLRHDPAAGLKIAGNERQLPRRVDDAVARGQQESENEDSQPGCPHSADGRWVGGVHSTSRRRTCQIILAWVSSFFSSG